MVLMQVAVDKKVNEISGVRRVFKLERERHELP
jgi:hypothetical protein